MLKARLQQEVIQNGDLSVPVRNPIQFRDIQYVPQIQTRMRAVDVVSGPYDAVASNAQGSWSRSAT